MKPKTFFAIKWLLPNEEATAKAEAEMYDAQYCQFETGMVNVYF
jgi:hypothetical protein